MMNWEQLLNPHRTNSTFNKETEQEKSRSEFDKDSDRIIFSHPFRRLQDKTQVFPLSGQDFVHTRLTHSLEVSSVGRSLGRKVGDEMIKRYPELLNSNISSFDFGTIVASACLCHDLGNPPFGHTGEEAISDYFKLNAKGKFFQQLVTEKEWEDLVNFEGNAQGFRLINQNSLKLTYATLAAFTKYPRESKTNEKDKNRASQKKYGFFQTEKLFVEEIARNTGLIRDTSEDFMWRRHPLVFLVEAADDICYNIIDMEDACRLGLISEGETIDFYSRILLSKFQPEKLAKIQSRNERIALLRAITISELINQTSEIFVEYETEILEGKFDSPIIDFIPAKDVLKEIKKFSFEKIYKSKQVIEIEIAGFEVLSGLLDEFSYAAYNMGIQQCSSREKGLIRLLPEEIRIGLENMELTVYERLRLVIDYISGMTDSNAINMYRKIKGIQVRGNEQ